VAGAGFAESGSALDLLCSSVQQGALTHAVLGQQGLITEAGYTERAQSYKTMADAATAAGNAANDAAGFATVTGIIKGAAGLASMFTGLPLSGVSDTAAGFVAQAPNDPSNPLRINQPRACIQQSRWRIVLMRENPTVIGSLY
jgi:hypothetical protein